MKAAPDTSKILRVGGTVGFDFMNTNYKLVDRIEVLDSPAALLFWLVDSGLITERDVKAIKQRFTPGDLNRLLSEALELRARLRAFVAAFKEEGVAGLPKEDLQYLNNLIRRGSTPLQIEAYGENHIRLQRAHDWNSVEEVLTILVESVIQAISEEDFELIKRCENEKCPLWFVDRTKAHRRKFCSAAICGNRHKQANFRERRRND